MWRKRLPIVLRNLVLPRYALQHVLQIMKSKVLAISAIAAGFVAITLTLGAYIQFIDLFTLAVSSVFVILPLYYKSYKGCVMTFLAGGTIALLCSLPTIAFTIVFPTYAAFFGLYPIVRHFTRDKNLNKYLCYIIGMVWCVAAVYGLYFYYTAVIGLNFSDLPYWVADYILYLLAPAGIVFYIIYDRYVIVVKFLLDKLLGRILK